MLPRFSADMTASSAKNDLRVLKKLLAYRMSLLEKTTTTTSPVQLLPEFSADSLNSIVNVSMVSEFYGFIGANTSLQQKVRNVFLRAVPFLHSIHNNHSYDGGPSSVDLRRQTLLALASDMQPLIGPFAASNPNFTADVSVLGQQFFPQMNRTSRGGGGGGGGSGWGHILPIKPNGTTKSPRL
ncbi:hypothetical protein BV898_13354 [Hypsibius exemplaris]|uniref:Uncharacterized protein n=1 Tax=Hypsibius exemplaris TaxID=2072580 RepID=A0A1W0WB67_HYPEX|nr:hypothetical protein BV898_13354 [Hypsibius exemplaris]